MYAPHTFPVSTTDQRGFVLPVILATITLASALGMYAVRTSPSVQAQVQAATQTRAVLATASSRDAVTHAAAILASETTDAADGYPLPPAMLTGQGGPAGGGFIPTSSRAPRFAGERELGYCAWDNGPTTGAAGRIAGSNTPASAVFAVVAPGQDGVIATSCAQAAAGQAQGDDVVVSYSTAQLRSLNSLHVGPSVATGADLAALDTSLLHEGEIRLVRSTNAIYSWSATAGWQAATAAGGGLTPEQAQALVQASLRAVEDGSAAAPSIAFAAAPDTGLYRAAGGIGWSVAGTTRLVLNSQGATVTGRVAADSAALGSLTASSLAVNGTTSLAGALTASGGISTTTLTATGLATVPSLRLTGQVGDPVDAAAGQLGYRTDTADMRYYDGTRWVSMRPGLLAHDTGSNLLSSNVSGARTVASNSGSNDGLHANVLIGEDAGARLGGSGGSWAFDNVAVGRNALTGGAVQSANTAQRTVALGSDAGRNITSGSNNTLVGAGTGTMLTTGAGNTLLGFNANTAAPTTSQGVAVGIGALVGTDAVAVGAAAQASDQSVATGAGATAINGGVALGYKAKANGTVSYGYRAAAASTSVPQVAIGQYAGEYSSDVGVALGTWAAQYAEGVSVAIGTATAQYLSGAQGGTVAVGEGALSGHWAGGNNGNDNTAVGYYAMYGVYNGGNQQIKGSRNTALGLYAGYGATGYSDQVIVGARALFDATSQAPLGGDGGVYVGASVSGIGAGHTLIGAGASSQLPASNNRSNAHHNTALGYGASIKCDVSTDTGCTTTTAYSYATAIGAGARVASSNTVVLGRVDSDVVVIGAAQADTATSGFGRLQVHGAITPGADAAHDLGSGERRWRTVYASDGLMQTSDARLKTDVAAIDPAQALEAVGKLKPVRYSWLDGRPGRKVGLLAQELVTVLPELVHMPTSPADYYSVNYAELSAVLAAAIQDVSRRLAPVSVTQTTEGTVLKVNGILAADVVRAKLVEVERLRVQQLEADRIQARDVVADRIRSGEATVPAGAGCAPVLALQADAAYTVHAVSPAGWGLLRVSTPGGQVQVQTHTQSELDGVDLQVLGGQVCAVAAGGQVRASWLRTL